MADRNNFQYILDPLKLAGVLWPKLMAYRKEREILYSFFENDWTNVSAAHKLGKDWTAALIALVAFLSRDPCRGVTHSVDGSQLEKVLWGEIYSLIDSAKYPLRSEKGGPLLVNHLHIRKLWTNGPRKGEIRAKSYLIGRQVATPEGMSGHHLPRLTHYRNGLPIPPERMEIDDWCTFFIGDECSGVAQETIEKSTEWAHRLLLIGNPYECENQFKWAVEGNPARPDYAIGDIPRFGRGGYERKVFEMSWRDSPNVQLALDEIREGKTPTGTIKTPGVLSWTDLLKRRKEWDEVKKQVGLEGKWYRGAAELMFPPRWLDRAEGTDLVKLCRDYPTEAIGIDPAEGGDATAMAAVNRYGVKEVVSRRTPDTAKIVSEAIAFVQRHRVPWSKVGFDRGGGGFQHADRIRDMGSEYRDVRTVDFGGAVGADPHIGRRNYSQIQAREEAKNRYADRRAEMYGDWMELMDPAFGFGFEPTVVVDGKVMKDTVPGLSFALPADCFEVRRQIAVLPKEYDRKGKLLMLEKSRRKTGPNERKTWNERIGRSPDEADAVATAIYIMLHDFKRIVAGTPGFTG